MENTVPSIPPKYFLKSFISRRSDETGVPKSEIVQELAQSLNLSKRQVYVISNYPIGSDKSMTTDQLVICADYFGCTPDQLMHPVYRTNKSDAVPKKEKAEKA